jgi:hypothetical protein
MMCELDRSTLALRSEVSSGRVSADADERQYALLRDRRQFPSRQKV